jgi:hypothetical protein
MEQDTAVLSSEIRTAIECWENLIENIYRTNRSDLIEQFNQCMSASRDALRSVMVDPPDEFKVDFDLHSLSHTELFHLISPFARKKLAWLRCFFGLRH